MDNLIKSLRKYQVFNIFMFVFTVLGTLITVVLGWRQFYDDYLSVKVEIPIWLAFVLAFVVFLLAMFSSARKYKKANAPLELVMDQTYGVQRLDVGGKRYVKCNFKGTELILDVGRGFGFERCNFNGTYFTWGEDASKMIHVLSDMYSDDSFKPLIDQMFVDIRNKTIPIAMPLNK